MIGDLKVYPLMSAPGEDGKPTVRPLGTSEAGAWLKILIERQSPGFDVHYTSHSLRATCLSYCAKRGTEFLDRLALGYHTGPLKMANTYSRDTASHPIHVLCQVLEEIWNGTFIPDSTRSGRLITPNQGVSSGIGPKEEQEIVSISGDENEVGEDATDGQQVIDESFPCSCSSSSSNEACAVLPRVRPLPFKVPEGAVMWKHRKLRTCRMDKDNRRIFFCGRLVNDVYEVAQANQRFGAHKCRQRFNRNDQL